MSIEVKEDGDNFVVFLDGKNIGWVGKEALQDSENLQKVLNKVLYKFMLSLSGVTTGRSSKKEESFGEHLFHICTGGLFEK